MGFLSRFFVQPAFLWLLPLVALPIIIHLLNRIRYKRVRWAAMVFLLSTERRAVRRAKLQQWILMALRTLLLAAALGVLAQPIFRGGLARLLGGSAQVAVLVDASASMSASHAAGSAYELAKRSAGRVLDALPHASKAMASQFAVDAESTFRQPITDKRAVASEIRAGQMTSGTGDMERSQTIHLIVQLHITPTQQYTTGRVNDRRHPVNRAGQGFGVGDIAGRNFDIQSG